MFGIVNANAKNILVQYIFQKNLLKMAPKYLKGELVDIGCGEKYYEPVLAPFISKYWGVDHPESLHNLEKIDILASAYNIPVEKDWFDCVLCSAVLEHLEEPEAALRESWRILKPEGYAIYSIPFIWHIHEAPRDFYRYSKYGIEYLFQKVGFEITELQALSGFWVTFGQLLVYNIYRINRGPLKWFRIVAIVSLIIQVVVYFMDKLDKTEQWTWMYLVVARKTKA